MTCGVCQFYVGDNRMGYCRRFPENITKQAGNWCGEFRSIPIDAITTVISIAKGESSDQTVARQDSSAANQPDKEPGAGSSDGGASEHRGSDGSRPRRGRPKRTPPPEPV